MSRTSLPPISLLLRSLGIFLALAGLLVTSGCSGTKPPLPVLDALSGLAPEQRVPVVLVPGITGSALYDREKEMLIWGRAGLILRPRDGGYALVRPIGDPVDGPATDVEAPDVLYRMKLGPLSKDIYKPILDTLEANGYRRGDLKQPSTGADLYTYAYDWRSDNIYAAQVLRQRLDALAVLRGDDRPMPVDLICQSNGAHICRYLLKYGGEPLEAAEAGTARPSQQFTIRKIILAGTSNGGGMRILREVHRGRKYVPVVGRTMHPEVLFSMPAVFQDLPAYVHSPFVDAEGREMALDLFNAEHWIDNGWSVFREDVRRRLRRRPDLFGTEEDRQRYLRQVLDRSRRLHLLLSQDVPHFQDTRYYSIQSRHTATPHLAVVDSSAKRPARRLVFTGDKPLKKNPTLASAISRPGDGHASVDSQLSLSPQERAAMAASPFMTPGGHFELILELESLRHLVEYLSR